MTPRPQPPHEVGPDGDGGTVGVQLRPQAQLQDPDDGDDGEHVPLFGDRRVEEADRHYDDRRRDEHPGDESRSHGSTSSRVAWCALSPANHAALGPGRGERHARCAGRSTSGSPKASSVRRRPSRDAAARSPVLAGCDGRGSPPALEASASRSRMLPWPTSSSMPRRWAAFPRPRPTSHAWRRPGRARSHRGRRRPRARSCFPPGSVLPRAHRCL